eukprot:12169802-Alexandrium_andersonii.AAC.1
MVRIGKHWLYKADVLMQACMRSITEVGSAYRFRQIIEAGLRSAFPKEFAEACIANLRGVSQSSPS